MGDIDELWAAVVSVCGIASLGRGMVAEVGGDVDLRAAGPNLVEQGVACSTADGDPCDCGCRVSGDAHTGRCPWKSVREGAGDIAHRRRRRQVTDSSDSGGRPLGVRDEWLRVVDAEQGDEDVGDLPRAESAFV